MYHEPDRLQKSEIMAKLCSDTGNFTKINIFYTLVLNIENALC